MQRHVLAAVQHRGVPRRVASPLQTLARAADIAREILRYDLVLLRRHVVELYLCALHRRTRAEGDMSGDRGICLTEARSDYFVLLRQLRLALRAVRLYRVFVVRACHGARVGKRIFGGGAVLVVRQQRPFAVTDHAAEHAVPNVILPVRAHHFPFDGHGTLFRTRRGNHLADIRAVGHGGGSDIGIEHTSVDRDAHAVLFRFADRTAGNIQHGFGLILVHGRCFAPRLPCLVAARIAVVDMPRQIIQLDAVTPFQTHRCGVFHVLPEFDLHLHLRLYLACLHP